MVNSENETIHESEKGCSVKRFWRLAALLVLAVGLSACGTAKEEAGTEVSVPETEALTEETEEETDTLIEAETEMHSETEEQPEETPPSDEPAELPQTEPEAERAPWAVVDEEAYAEYEELIVTELLAAAQGDRDAFMACVDEELLVDVWLAAYQYQETDSVSEEELSEFREEFLEEVAYISGYAFEDLSEVLGEDFDGEILVVQMFDKADYALPADVQLYGRILLTVMNAENEYQEVEGGVYAIGDRKGVLLQPD